ncbi:MAG TPA: response regulator transcription factor [Thermoleophilaceae bacterium]|jgi:DNA-binding NarL/FixJ family response regulator
MAPFQDMISVAIVDDHPAIRLGLAALVRREPGFVLALNASDGPEATAELERHPIDIAVADFQLPSGDGLALCRRLKKAGYCRAAVLYSAFANEWLTIAARVGGLDGVVNKGVPASDLFEALRLVGKGCQSFADTAVNDLRQASELVEPEDQPVLGMLLNGTAEQDIGSLLGVSAEAVQLRVERMLAVLKPRAKS